MHLHDHDENNAPDQARVERPTDPDAHRALGVEGGSPRLRICARSEPRDKTAAGFLIGIV